MLGILEMLWIRFETYGYSVDRNKYQIQIPLPPKIDPTVTMMQVEEKPDVTYADVGGCKEQIEKLREVVEVPLLQVTLSMIPMHLIVVFSRSVSSTWVSIHQRACCCTVLLEPVKP